MFTNRVSMLPGVTQVVQSENALTVQGALDLAGFNPAGFVVSVGGVPATDFTRVLTNGQEVFLTKASKGARA